MNAQAVLGAPVAALHPSAGHVDVHLGAARALVAACRYDEAIVACKRGVFSDPADPRSYLLLADILYFAGLHDDTLTVLDAGLSQVPASFALAGARCMATLRTIYRDDSELRMARTEYSGRLVMLRRWWRSGAVTPAEGAAAVGMIRPFFLPYQGCDDRLLQAAHGSLVAEIMAAAYPRWASCARRPLQSGERIRIGFVSGCLGRRHSVWRIPMRGWVEKLDRDRFQLFGYHTRSDCDDQTDQARVLFDRFERGQHHLSAWAATIERDEPHVLVYPEIGADDTSLQLAALRLAPVQCTSLGQPVTSGLPTIDYFLSSDLMEPPDAQEHYTERLVQLPGLGTAYRPEWAAWGDTLPSRDSWAGLDLPPGTVRFLCCQNMAKYLPAYDDVLPRIAVQLPAARFLFVETKIHPTTVLRRRLAAAFSKRGLSALTFCRFVRGMPHGEFSALVRDADVFLDTIGWSGFNTTLEALTHGVPVVTLPGDFMRGRHSAGILSGAGVVETIADTTERYVTLAVKLGRDLEWRLRVGGRMRAGAVGVFDDAVSVAHLERFLEGAAGGADQG